MNDRALDALLAEYAAPPVPAGLAARVAAAALALPQEPRLAYARRAAVTKRHDRRGKWLRRPLLVGGIAFGLAVSGAVAATLAGLRIDWPAVEEMLADLPFLGRADQRDSAMPSRPTPSAPLVVEPAPAETGHAAPRVDDAAPPSHAAAAPVEAAPVETPDPLIQQTDVPETRLIERRPAAPPPAAEFPRPEPPPPAPVEREGATPIPVAEPRDAAPVVDEAPLRPEGIERTERLRAARQAQIERLQRVQQRRERIRRLRRD